MDPVTLIGGGLSLLGSLFGRKKSPTPAQNIVSQAQGAREAAAKYGFNPLTMLQYGQPGGSMAQGDVAPLASLSILGDMLTQNFGPDAKDRREHNQLNNDLLRLQLDQARGLVRQPSDPSAVAGLTDRAPSLGRSATTTVGTAAGEVAPRLRNTFETFSNAGQSTDIPLGPDLDEVLTGAVIAGINRDKARVEAQKNQTVGVPLSIPFGIGVSRVRELLPPSSEADVERRRLARRRPEPRPDMFWLYENYVDPNKPFWRN